VSQGGQEGDRREKRAEVIRLVVSCRERAPRSPRLERALKRLIWRYSRAIPPEPQEGMENAQD
jgi:hypothetical protein